MSSSACAASQITGMKPGPFPIGVTTVQIDDPTRADPGDPKRSRSLQTEIWYPAIDKTKTMPKNSYSEFILGGKGNSFSDAEKKEIFEVANDPKSIGGYRDGISIEELDDPNRTTWKNDAVRDAPVRNCGDGGWPLVIFSHGYGAFRCSYLYWTEFLASHGFVVAACDHPGDARFTLIDGKPVVPGGNRSSLGSIARERPLDVFSVINGIEKLTKKSTTTVNTSATTNSVFAGKNIVNTNNIAISGMSFGGDTVTQVLEYNDPRIKAAVLKCPAVGKFIQPGQPGLHEKRKNKHTPIMIMLGTEDTVIGTEGNAAARTYFEGHNNDDNDDSYLLEIIRGGHVSFTSCEMYDPDYGNGISTGSCPSLTHSGESYEPLDIIKQHTIINSYGLAFLNTYTRKEENGHNKTNEETGLGASIDTYNKSYLQKNKFAHMDGEALYRKRKER